MRRSLQQYSVGSSVFPLRIKAWFLAPSRIHISKVGYELARTKIGDESQEYYKHRSRSVILRIYAEWSGVLVLSSL